MVVLVVGNHQEVVVETIPWGKLTGVLLLNCVPGGSWGIKQVLKDKCKQFGIAFHIGFALPPDDVVPPEMLLGFGYRLDREVILYGDGSYTVHCGAVEKG